MRAEIEIPVGSPKCGHPTVATGKPCKQPAGSRTPHLGIGKCWLHGGRSPSHIIAAERIKLEREALQYGGPIEIDPHEALIQEVYRSAGHVQFLAEKVQALEDEELVESSLAGRVPSLWIRWYAEERKRLVDAAATCIKAGVAERRVQIAEAQGKMLAEAIRRILGALNLTPEQERLAPEVVRGVLTALPSAA